MKGIYVLDNSIQERDFDLISRAGQELDYVTVAIQLEHHECGNDCLADVSRVIRGLRERDILDISIDYFRTGELLPFLRDRSCRIVRIDHADGTLKGFRKFQPHIGDVKLIVPAHLRGEYSDIDFPKYFID